MAEYNVQINKYNANNLGYDQLYPQSMKHADTHLLNGSDPINVGELGVSNRNLLDNAYFANPDAIIDQRGGWVVPPNTSYYNLGNLAVSVGKLTTYATVIRYATYNDVSYPVVLVNGTEYMTRNGTAVRGYTGAGYGIDRWYSTAVCLIESDGITIMDSIFQRIENPEKLNGFTLTFSVLGANGKLYTGTRVFNDTNDVVFYGPKDGIQLLFNKYWNGFQIVGEFKVKAAKLELGTVQTLAHQDADGNWVLNDPPPDKGMELLKCQRYFWRSWTGERKNQNSILGVVFGNNRRITGFDYPVEMRTKPSITVYGLTGASKVTEYVSDADYGPASPVYWDTQRCIALGCDEAGLSNDNRVYYFIEANAEL